MRPLAPLLLAALCVAQDPTAIATAARALIGAPQLAGGRAGVVVNDLRDGSVLFEHDATAGFMTASNMKLISGAVALLTLGPDFTYTTRLATTAKVTDGVVEGDLLLIGDGDPALGGRPDSDPMSSLQRLASAMATGGIRRVKGRLVAIDDVQSDRQYGVGWQWDYLDDDYAAAFGGLNFAENIVMVTVQGTAAGSKPQVRVMPELPGVMVQFDVVCGPEGTPDRLRASRQPGTAVIRLTGTLPAMAPERTFKIAAANPTLLAGQAMKVALARMSVQVDGPVVDGDEAKVDTAGAVDLALERQRPLREILVPMMKDSQNLYAEQFLRTAARRSNGDSDAIAACARTALAPLGVDLGGALIIDGSGLSRRNLVQPRQLAALLAGMWRSPLREPFVQSLPVAGHDGTLKSRFKNGPARGHVHAKTGFIGGVVALSGYVMRPQADAAPLQFVVLLNNFTCETDAAKAAVDRFVDELAVQAGWPREAAPAGK